MPARPHRTVDRVTGILETVSLSPRGVTLAELANALNAAKSSVQELTNGLLARGLRATRLAFNRGATFADAFVVATPLLARDGRLIAAISAAVDPSQADRLDDLGDELKTAVAELASRYGFNPLP